MPLFFSLIPFSLPRYKKQCPATPEGEQEAREAFFQDLADLLLQDQPSIVVCAGFMVGDFRAFVTTLEDFVPRFHPAYASSRWLLASCLIIFVTARSNADFPQLVVTASFLDRLAATGVLIINLHPALPGGESLIIQSLADLSLKST